jgi:hypothetical protein
MHWDLLDILTFSAMVAAAVIIVLVARRRSRIPAYRFAAAVAALCAFLLAWMNGAVGIIGNEENAANLLFFGVLAVAATGSAIARFRASGLAKALYATAAAQVLVAAIALVFRLGASGPAWPRGLLIITAMFTTLWLVSGWLFRRAARAGRRLFED